MTADDEMTAVQLHKLLNDKGYAISFLSSSLQSLTWVDVSCQLILPAYTRSEQRKEARSCTAKSWQELQQCHPYR